MDHADNQVKGFDRYFPNKTSKSLLVALLTVPAGLYTTEPVSVMTLLPNQSKTEIPLALLALCFFVALVIAICLIVNLGLVAHHSKHSRIRHYTNHPESMDIRNLVKRFTLRHYASLFVIFALGLSIGLVI